MQIYTQVFNFDADNTGQVVETQALDNTFTPLAAYSPAGVVESGGGQYIQTFSLPSGFLGYVRARLHLKPAIVDTYAVNLGAGAALPAAGTAGTGGTPADPRAAAILQLVAGRLQRQPADLDPAVFEPELAFLRTELSARFPCVGDPAALSGNDAAFFDRAAGLLLAARLFASTVQGEGGHVLTQTTADGTREQFAALDPALPPAWAKEAMTAVSRVSCIHASYAGPSSSFTVFGAFGRSRALESRCGTGPLLGFGLSLLDLALFPLNYGSGFEFPLSAYEGTGGYSPDYFPALGGEF